MTGRFPALLIAAALLATGCGGEPETSSDKNAPAEAAAADAAGPAKLTDMRDAEEEGRAYPTAPPPDRTFPTFRKDLPGTEKRECVEVRVGTANSPGDDVRSGEFAAAVMYLYEEAGNRFAKIGWKPLHLHEEYFENGGDVSGLEVRVASLSEPTEIVTFRKGDVSGGGEAFYSSGTPLPGEGPWRMVATSGPDWGCFDLEPASGKT